LNNICINEQSIYYSYCPLNNPIQDNPCSKLNNPISLKMIGWMLLFIFYTTVTINAVAFSFYKYRYENGNPIIYFFMGVVFPYFCWVNS